MQNRLNKRVAEAREGGFTLIELLIVIVILGVLAGIVVFAVGSARGDSVVSSCKADVKTINTAQEAHKAKHGGYTTIAELKTKGFIKELPPTSEYTIAWSGTAATGDINGGSVTTDCSA